MPNEVTHLLLTRSIPLILHVSTRRRRPSNSLIPQPLLQADHTTQHVVVFLPSFRVLRRLENGANNNSNAVKCNSNNNQISPHRVSFTTEVQVCPCRATDNDAFATNIQVSLRKKDYGEPGSREYRKNTASATYPLAEKFGAARHKIVTSAAEDDKTKNRFVQQVLVGLTHREKEGHERAKKYDLTGICTVADYSGNTSSADCSLPGDGVMERSTSGQIGSIRSPIAL
eukprot:scaffold7949_cov37-Cyclotella_meneghiniana.AAC.11